MKLEQLTILKLAKFAIWVLIALIFAAQLIPAGRELMLVGVQACTAAILPIYPLALARQVRSGSSTILSSWLVVVYYAASCVFYFFELTSLRAEENALFVLHGVANVLVPLLYGAICFRLAQLLSSPGEFGFASIVPWTAASLFWFATWWMLERRAGFSKSKRLI